MRITRHARCAGSVSPGVCLEHPQSDRGHRWGDRRFTTGRAAVAPPRRAAVAGLVATGLAGSSLLMPGLAAAAVPTFPDNIVVFPEPRLRHPRGLPGPRRQGRHGRGRCAAPRSSAPRQGSRRRRATSPSRSTTPAASAGAPGTGASRSPRTSGPATRCRIKFDGAELGDTTVAGRRGHRHRRRLETATRSRSPARSPPASTRPRSSSASSTPTSTTPTSTGATSARSPVR